MHHDALPAGLRALLTACWRTVAACEAQDAARDPSAFDPARRDLEAARQQQAAAFAAWQAEAERLHFDPIRGIWYTTHD